MKINIPTEPIGSIPRPQYLIDAILNGTASEDLFDRAVKETILAFESTGSTVITDGEQRKASFATYPLHGLKNLGPNGVVIPFHDGHTRQLPVLTSGPFHYASYAVNDLKKAKTLSNKKFKQAVISASALSLLYPADSLPGYSREKFMEDLVNEAEKDIRLCLNEGVSVQIDFTEGRLALKLDPSKALLKSFIDLNNMVLARFTKEERQRIGVHTCPGGDHDSTHSADVDYTQFLPELFQINAGNFFVQLSSEADRVKALKTMKPFASSDRIIFIGVTDPISKTVETAEVVKERILEAAKIISPEYLGTTDDCGFSPFCDDVSTSRDLAFSKIRSRVEGTKLAQDVLNS
jgi:5-methyltetrahydropteroyltriglutamate--homocysteine methyltransferase